MYIKFFKNKRGGSKGSVDYLLNEREAEGTAKVLKGNPKFTKAIIGELKTKQKVTVGSINLSKGENLTLQEKETIMQDFEKTLCPGMSENQYNILWVEHTDKGRIELNFVIPKIELTTQKAFNPYYHKLDFARIDMFEDIQNIKYNLQSKKDPANAQTLQGEKKNINIVKGYKELDSTLYELVKSRDIQSREHLISLLNENNIKVTRSNKDGISVKLPDSKKAHRLKGGIYNERFTSIEELETISEETDRRIEEFQSRDTSRELEQTIKKLNEYNEQKARKNREKYQRRDKQTTRLENTKHSNNEQPSSRIISRSDISQEVYENRNSFTKNRSSNRKNSREKSESDGTKRHTTDKRAKQRDRQINEQSPSDAKVDDTREVQSRGRARDLPKTEQEIHIPRGRLKYKLDMDKGELNDIRRRTLKRIREGATAQQRAYEEARQSRGRLYKSITTDAREIREKLEENSIKLSREYATVAEQSKEFVIRIRETSQLSNELNRATTEGERITNTVRSIVEGFKKFGRELKEQFQSAIQQSGDTTRTAQQNIDYKEQREKRYNAPSYEMRR